MADAFESFKTATILQFRAAHRRDRRPAETLDSDTAELDARLELIRFAMQGAPPCQPHE